MLVFFLLLVFEGGGGQNIKSPRNQILRCPADDISLICICSLPPHSLMNASLHTSASNEGYPKVRNHGEGPY